MRRYCDTSAGSLWSMSKPENLFNDNKCWATDHCCNDAGGHHSGDACLSLDVSPTSCLKSVRTYHSVQDPTSSVDVRLDYDDGSSANLGSATRAAAPTYAPCPCSGGSCSYKEMKEFVIADEALGVTDSAACPA